MRIKKDSEAYLNSLVCQRVKDSKENLALIRRFVNEQNPNIAKSLKESRNTDKKDKLAYYIVKDPKLNVPLLFFSLKCGELFIPYNMERKQEILRNAEMLYAAATGHKAEDWAKNVIQNMKNRGLSARDIEKEFERRYERNLSMVNLHACDKTEEGNNIVRVLKTYPAVEIVHFCAYDPVGKVDFPENWTKKQRLQWLAQYNPVLKKWLQEGMEDQSLGEALFWKFVVPKIQDIRKLVGCEYVYLFAADRNRYGKLVRYYERLGFEFRDDLYVNKPEYDYTCYFMCQPVTALRTRQNKFFAEYHPDDAK